MNLDGSQNLDIKEKGTQDSILTATNSSNGVVDAPISCIYLEFETILPSPTSIALPKSDGVPPELPDLRPFISPFDWSESRKTFMIWLSCASTVVAAYSAGSYAAGAKQMTKEWGVCDVALNVGITAFTTGFGIAPMVLAPFSEINGRKPVFIATGALFVCEKPLRTVEGHC
jgi:hypothetical protein